MKYSRKFQQDYDWYKKVSTIFDFDGRGEYLTKSGVNVISVDHSGVSAKEAFYVFDSKGKVLGTFEPDELRTLMKTKGSVNLHIKMYAKDRANGLFPKLEFNKFCKHINAPDWFVKAVEQQKLKYY